MGNHIYILDTDLLKDPGLYACCCSRVPRARREKAAACRYESDRRLSLGAGILLTEGLVRAGLPEAEIASSIVQSEKGKPCLAGSSADRVHFNLSHSGILAVCAVSDAPVGVDIEKERKFRQRLVDYVFRPEEVRYIRDHYGSRADAGFTALWTVKESVMKYFGEGIRMTPKTICVDLQGPVRAVCEGFPCEGLVFTQYALPEGCAMTVCSGSGSFPAEPVWMGPADLNYKKPAMDLPTG